MGKSEKVIVVGAGIAGLAAAFRLQQAGHDVTVLERSDEEFVGGRMATIVRDGYPIDVGATLLPRSYRRMLALAVEAGLADQVIPAGDIIGIVLHGTVRRVPTAATIGMLIGVLRSGLSRRDIIRVLADLRRLHPIKEGWTDLSHLAPHDRGTVTEYAAARGLRRDTLDYFLGPLTSSLCLGQPEETSMIAPFVFLDIIFGGHGFFTSRQGAGFLPQGLARKLNVEYQSDVTSVEERPGQVSVSWTRAGGSEQTAGAAACVIAVPPPQILPIFGQLSSEQRDVLSSFRFSHAIHVAFPMSSRTAERSMFLQFSREDAPEVVGVILEHNLAPTRYRPGAGLALAYMPDRWASKNWDLPDDKVAATALAAIDRMGVIPELPGHALTPHVLRLYPGLALRGSGDYAAMARLSASLRQQHRVRFAGSDYLSHSSTNAALCSGEQAAAEIISSLGGAAAARQSAGPGARA